MGIRLTFLLFFFVLGLQSSFGAINELLMSCNLKYLEGEIIYNGSYRAIREGDHLFAEYRHNEDGDFISTDDVRLNSYEGDKLAALNEDGLVDLLAKELDTSFDNISKVKYYGIDETKDNQYEMQIWELFNLSGDKIGKLGTVDLSWIRPCDIDER